MVDNEKLKIIDYNTIKHKNKKKEDAVIENNAEENFFELIKIAYNQLKHTLYFDKFPLNYRYKLAKFEEGDLEKKLKDISKNLYFSLNDFDNNIQFIENLLNNISYTPYPKKVSSPLDNDENGLNQLISNDRKHSEYQLDSFELFLDTKSIEPFKNSDTDGSTSFVTIQIIAILWIQYIGVLLDDLFDPTCYGSRIKPEFRKNPENSRYIYHRYFEKYTEWRDGAFKKAKFLLKEEKRDSVIISLDVTRFYYSIEMDFSKLIKEYEENLKDKYPHLIDFYQTNEVFIKNLNEILKQIHIKYQDVLYNENLFVFINGRNQEKPNNPCLPIGLLSSGILGNWFLADFDKEIIQQYNPDYYGRYVDDMLLVLKASEPTKLIIKDETHKSNKIYRILKTHFSFEKSDSEIENNLKSKIFIFSDNPSNIIYLNPFNRIKGICKKIEIKTEKVRLYYFDKESSQVILTKLTKQLQQDASFFRFLPDDEWNTTLDEVAYDLITKGSIQKIRNIVDVTENEYELVKYLSNLAIKYHYIDLKSSEIDQDIEQLFHFFSGVNIIKHNKLWERIYSILIICKRYNEICIFFDRAKDEISKVQSHAIFLNIVKNKLENHRLFSDVENISQYFADDIRKMRLSDLAKNLYNSSSENDFIREIKNLFPGENTKSLESEDIHSLFSELNSIGKQLTIITSRIQKILEHNLILALAIPSGLLGYKDTDDTIFFNKCEKDTKKEIKTNLFEKAKCFRQSGLIRDQYFLYPLLNLIAPTDFSLIDLNNIYSSKMILEKKLNENFNKNINYPSKIIHLWEYLLLIHYLNLSIKPEPEYSLLEDFFSYKIINENGDDCKIINNEFEYLNCFYQKISPKIKLSKNKSGNSTANNTKGEVVIEEYFVPKEKNSDELKVGIVHLQISDENISDNLNPLKSRNFSLKRQIELYNILNKSEKEKCDLVIFPELSIPVYWLPLMVAFAKRRQIGLVFGLEHWLVENDGDEYAYNFTVTVLPYKEEGKYHDCLVTIRNKNHYPLVEKEEIEKYHKKVPDRGNRSIYHLFHWRGASFTVFNCIELADINHKALFKSRIDFLIGIEHNKDTKYYSNIVDSIARDLHCYVIQVNVPHYGDSRVIQPKKSEIKDIASISRGKNSLLLTCSINIKSLRDFQTRNEKENECQNRDSFKPLPPGFDRELTLERGELDSKFNLKENKIVIRRTYY